MTPKIPNPPLDKGLCQQIGELVLRAGLAQALDIFPEDDLYGKDEDKAYLLYGFLSDAAMGHMSNPVNIIRWMEVGEHVLGAPIDLPKFRMITQSRLET